MNAFYTAVFLLLLTFIPFNHAIAKSDTLTIAVSSNFAPILKKIAPTFEAQENLKVKIISAATGTLYQQILHGAPFDVFLSADSSRPDNIVTQELAYQDKNYSYAIGQLSFYSSIAPHLTFNDLLKKPNEIKKLAIANPAFAPYGVAAKEAMLRNGSWKNMQSKLILGINVNQTFQQVRSKTVTAGIVATSQLKLNGIHAESIPEHFYRPIIQKAVIIKNTQQAKNAEHFIDYLLSPSIQQQIRLWGYKSVSSTRY